MINLGLGLCAQGTPASQTGSSSVRGPASLHHFVAFSPIRDPFDSERPFVHVIHDFYYGGGSCLRLAEDRIDGCLRNRVIAGARGFIDLDGAFLALRRF